MTTIYSILVDSDWADANTHLDVLTHAQAVQQAQYLHSEGWTCASAVASRNGPLQLIKRSLELGGEKVLRATVWANTSGISILQIAASWSNDPAVFRLLISKAPNLQSAKAADPFTILTHQHLDRSNHAELLTLTRNCVAAYERKDFFSLIRHCRMSHPLRPAEASRHHLGLASPPPRRPAHHRLPRHDHRRLAALAPVRPRARHRARDHVVHRVERGAARGRELEDEPAAQADAAERGAATNERHAGRHDR